MSDETKGPENESEQLTPEELAKVAGGAAVEGVDTWSTSGYYWYCNANGAPIYYNGEGRSSAYKYDPATKSCIKV
jgi:hypothetical protein